jgi:hypothetical protein
LSDPALVVRARRLRAALHRWLLGLARTAGLLVIRLERLGARLGLSEALLGLVAALAADTRLRRHRHSQDSRARVQRANGASP